MDDKRGTRGGLIWSRRAVKRSSFWLIPSILWSCTVTVEPLRQDETLNDRMITAGAPVEVTRISNDSDAGSPPDGGLEEPSSEMPSPTGAGYGMGESGESMRDADGGAPDAMRDTDDGAPDAMRPQEQIEPNPVFQCSDGLDNDDDGLRDEWDPGCTGREDDDEDDDVVGACQNGLDDDDNGLVDFPFDPGCSAVGDETESTPAERAVCANGLDDDRDGLIDYPVDPGCSGRGTASEIGLNESTVCANGLDDDGDGAIDFPDDVDCHAASSTSESSQCGWPNAIPLISAGPSMVLTDIPIGNSMDVINLSCAPMSDVETIFVYRIKPGTKRIELTIVEPDDNDMVGLGPLSLAVFRDCGQLETQCATREESGRLSLVIDAPRAGLMFIAIEGVESGQRLRLRDTPFADCGNGLDDDGDGHIDASDVGCVTASDLDEATADYETPCSNGLDDDEDGRIDYPDDADCASAAGASEDEICGANPAPFLFRAESSVYGIDFPADVQGARPSCIGNARMRGLGILRLEQPHDAALYIRQGQRLARGAVAVWSRCDQAASELICQASQVRSGFNLGTLNVGEYTIFMATSNVSEDAETQVHLSLLPTVTECSDGIDNDGDNLVDAEDPSCAYPRALSETGTDEVRQCNDGQDNDSDGVIDFPEDPACEAAGDDDEISCVDHPLWMPVNCTAVESVWTLDPTLLNETQASRARVLFTGLRTEAPEDRRCSLDGIGWVSTEFVTISNCSRRWWHFGPAITGPCLGHDDLEVRRLVKGDHECWDYTLSPGSRPP